ncbi:hypothetical protein Tco_0646731 [Tanacetum coccineum]
MCTINTTPPSMIGSLMYLTALRPDIMFAVCACARFQVTPKASHLHATFSPKDLMLPGSVRSKLQLADATGIHNLSDAEIYAGLATLGYVTKGAAVDQGEGSAQPAEPHHTLVDPISSTSQPLIPIAPQSISPPHTRPHIQSHQSPPYSHSFTTSYHHLHLTHHLIPHHLGHMKHLSLKKVKSLEKALKKKFKKVIVSASEGEEPEDQGRIIQDIDDDPLVSLVRESMKEKLTDFVTPTKALEETQKEEEISPTILEAAKTLSKVTSQSVSKAKLTDKGKRYRRRARSMAKKINTELDAEDEINTGRVEINSGIEDVNTGSSKVDTRGYPCYS